jgi:hypothetical protein
MAMAMAMAMAMEVRHVRAPREPDEGLSLAQIPKLLPLSLAEHRPLLG